MGHITQNAIDINVAFNLAHHNKAGAIVVFSGEVRNHQDGKSVDFLEYEAHIEMAEKGIESILNEAKSIWELHFVYCQHRIGKVNLSESAVVVITSASHRDVAYDANRFIIDKVKSDVPIWKKEHFSDGNVIWV